MMKDKEVECNITSYKAESSKMVIERELVQTASRDFIRIEQYSSQAETLNKDSIKDSILPPLITSRAVGSPLNKSFNSGSIQIDQSTVFEEPIYEERVEKYKSLKLQNNTKFHHSMNDMLTPKLCSRIKLNDKGTQ
mmetsp:Transcript_32381/g.28672  ORF Transcript_32381/g.28672 Transcript_32381/m.28672 type:complete len:136 (+) Transcript_32381:157-564(+)